MKRFLASSAVAIGLAALAVATSACNPNWSGSSTPAARIDGTTAVTTGELKAVMADVKKDKGFLCVGNAGIVPSIDGVGTGTYSMSYADQVLAALVKFQLTIRYADAHHLYLPTTASFVATARQQLVDGDNQIINQLAQSQVNCSTTGEAIVTDAGPHFQREMIANEIAQDAIEAHLAGASLHPNGLAGYEQANPDVLVDACTSIIQVASEKLATSLQHQIAAGASFAALAAKHSTATGVPSSGSVGCVLGDDWVDNLGQIVDALPVGKVSQPVAFNGGWLLFLVGSHAPVAMADILNEINQKEVTAFQAADGTAIRQARVQISPTYGTWTVTVSSSGLTTAIKPPGGQAAAVAPNPGAAGVTTTTASSTPLSGG